MKEVETIGNLRSRIEKLGYVLEFLNDLTIRIEKDTEVIVLDKMSELEEFIIKKESEVNE